MDHKTLKKLKGIKDPRGNIGIFSRGKNVYNATSMAAHRGGGSQFGRPKGSTKHVMAAKRRLGKGK